jgi:hypothetical protein
MGCQKLDKPTHRIGTNSMPQPSSGCKSKESKLNSVYTIHKKVGPEMSIHKTMDQFQNFIWRSSPAIEHHNSWTCLLNGIQPWMHLSICNNFDEHYSGREKFYYCFKMNVPKNCKEFEEYLRIFNTTRAPTYPSVPTALQQRSRDWNEHCTQPIQQRFLFSKRKYHCIHPKSGTNIFNTSKPRYPQETRF